MSDEELKVQDAIVNSLIEHYKAVIEQYKAENSEDKIIRRTLENFMRGLWEEIQMGELEYTTSEVYEMLEREIFTDNHVAIPSADNWIPVSERLPDRNEYIKNNGLFNVSDGNRSYSEWFDIYDKQMFGEPTMSGFHIDCAVTAWQPLPEPYKEGVTADDT